MRLNSSAPRDLFNFGSTSDFSASHHNHLHCQDVELRCDVTTVVHTRRLSGRHNTVLQSYLPMLDVFHPGHEVGMHLRPLEWTVRALFLRR